MQCVKPRNFRDFVLFQQIDKWKTHIHIVRKMVIISLRALIFSKVLYTVAVLLDKPLRRCSYLCRYIHFAQIYDFILI